MNADPEIISCLIHVRICVHLRKSAAIFLIVSACHYRRPSKPDANLTSTFAIAPARSASPDALAETAVADCNSALARAQVVAVAEYNSSPEQAQVLAAAVVGYKSSSAQAAVAADCLASLAQAEAVADPPFSGLPAA